MGSPNNFLQGLLESLTQFNPQASAALQQRKNVAETIRERLFNESLAGQQNDRANQEWAARQAETTYQHGRDTVADQQTADAKTQKQAQADQVAHQQYISGNASGDLMEVTPPSQASQQLQNPANAAGGWSMPRQDPTQPTQPSSNVFNLLMNPNQSTPLSVGGPTSSTASDTGVTSAGATAPTFNVNDLYTDPVTKKFYRPATPQEKSATQLATKKQGFTDFISDPTNKSLASDPDQLAEIHGHMVYGLPMQEDTMDKAETKAYKTIANPNATPQAKQSAQGLLNSIQQDKIKLEQAKRPSKELSPALVNNSYQYQDKKLESLAKPVEESLNNIGRAKTSLAQGTPAADAVAVPQIILALAGGKGVRITGSEQERLVGGRGNLDALNAWAQRWQTDPTKAGSLTPEQRRQAGALLDAQESKMRQRQRVVQSGRDALVQSNDVGEHRTIVNNTQKAYDAIDQPTTMKVRTKSGQVGTIPVGEFDPKLYDKL
jgi:hypothetical protein